MKKIPYYLLLMCMFAMSNAANAQWIRVFTPVQSSGAFPKIQAASASVVYMADANKKQLYKSVDSGNTWSYTPGAISSGFPNSIYFTSETTGYIAGDKGALYKTTDGGNSFTTISRPYQHYRDITFINATTGFIVGNGRVAVQPADSAFVLKTTDAGATWTYYNLGHTDQMRAVSFSSPMNGVAAGYNGRVHITTDGGLTWTAKPTGTASLLLDVFSVSQNVIYTGGYSGAFFQTVNGGDTWTPVVTGEGSFTTYSGMHFSDSANGYVASGALLAKTNSAWSKSFNINIPFLDVHFLNANTGFASGNDGTVAKYVGNTPILKMGNPSGDTRINSGQSYSITWSANAVDTIMIEYRTGPAQPWQTIAAKVGAKAGSYSWSVPSIETTTASVRVTSITDPALTSRTPDNIIITLQKSISITSPDKFGSSLIAGKKINIGWTSLNLDSVKIEYRTNASAPWALIATNVKARTGAYPFTVPAAITTDLQFRVSWINDVYYADSSRSGNVRMEALNTTAPVWSLQNPKPFLGLVRDIQKMDSNTLYALADPDLFVRSVDKGQSWTIVSNFPVDGMNLKSLHFPDGATGYVLAGNNYASELYKTADGGQSWSMVSDGIPGTAMNIRFATADSGWISGGNFAASLIMFTSNGGTSFTAQSTMAIRQINDLHIVNSAKAWAVSEDGYLLYTNNAGAQWDSAKKIANPLRDIYFTGNSGWAVGGSFSSRNVLRTTDAGATWSTVIPSGTGALDAIEMRDAMNGYIVSSAGSTANSLQRTTDGGATWTLLNTYVNPQGNLPTAARILMMNNTEGISYKISSEAATTFTLSGNNVSAWKNISTEVHKANGLTNYTYGGISMVDSTTGYVLGNYTLRTYDGGQSWNIAGTTDIFSQSSAVWFTAKDTGFACASKSGAAGIYRTFNGGQTWTMARSTGSATPFRMQFTDRLNGFALSNGSYDSLFKTTDGGQAWTGIAKPSGTAQGVCFVSATKGFVYGTEVHMTNDAGATWTKLTVNMDAGAYLTKMKFLNATTGFAVGYVGLIPGGGACAYIFKTTDGGLTWNRQLCPSFGGNTLRDVHFIDANNGFASGEGMMLQTTNGGQNWYISALPVPNGNTAYSISGMTFTDARNGWAIVGNNGNIIMKCNFKAPSVGPVISSLMLTSPNGGESWMAASQHAITWTASNVSNIKIEYRISAVAPWITVTASAAASAGTYSWTIPATASAAAMVRISDVSNAAIADSSNALFTITVPVLPVLSLTSPNGGENWIVASQHNITWTSANIDTINIAYRTSGASAWQGIARVAAGAGTYSWTIPNAASADVRVKISSLSLSDSSDAAFSITAASAPLLTLTAPNGGETWTAGDTNIITWTSANIDSVMIEYSTGGAYTPVARVAAISGAYRWTVADAPSATCKVRVTDVQSALSDSSDSVFEIVKLVTGIQEMPANSDAGVYPNPFSDVLSVHFNTAGTGTATISITDLTGKEVLSDRYELTADDQQIRIEQQLKPGLYMIHIRAGSIVKSFKVIKAN